MERKSGKKRKSREEKNENDACGLITDDPDELREISCASLLLGCLRTVKLFLERNEPSEKIKTEAKPEKNKLEYDDTDETIRILNRFKPPEIPQVAELRADVIENWSRPFWKQLTGSDVDEGQSRLTLGKLAVQETLFPLLNEDEKPDKNGIRVLVFGSDGKEYEMMFKLWAEKVYVLTGGWKKFCKDYGFVKHQDFVIVWMFRHRETRQICFVIASERFPIHKALSSRITKKVFGASKNRV